ncbi:MAG: signal peptide peptidase SppA [Arthrospira sp. SH-MAG29]|nr:signal peptide peptidase SppA [Arthrospira sp. SH-MAG29]MBS0017758.1 signal peptide peptidase SppA [Arthrospira sp. SH-MAG29]
MKEFLKYTLASVVGNLLGLFLVITFGIGGIAFLVVVSASRGTQTTLRDKSVLVLDLSVGIADTAPPPTPSIAIGQTLREDRARFLPLRVVLETIERASKDDKIVGLYLQGSSGTTPTGFGNLKEVRRALEGFKESGKTIIAYDTDWTEREYYLGSVADQIIIDPMGTVEMSGFSSQTVFLAGALERFGIGVQVTRVGQYKSAVEPFLRQEMSPENRQQMQQLLGDLWGEFTGAIASSRSLTTAQLQQIVNQDGFLMAADAKDREMVDDIAYRDEVAGKLRELTEEKEEGKQPFRQVGIQEYSRTPQVKGSWAGNPNSRNIIAVVYADGEIVDGSGGIGQVGGDHFGEELRKLRDNDRVKGIVLRVNSPGGSATASEVIAREVQLTREEKPIIVSMGNAAASGGYWIAMGGDRIFAEPTTVTGSIGVFGLLFNAQDIANQNGITWDGVKTGPFADLNSISRPKTDQELQKVQQIVDLIYQRFVSSVAQLRDLPQEEVLEMSQGRVWSGVQAEALGLVDQLGGLQDAIAAVAEKAELGDDWKLAEYPRIPSFEERLLESLRTEATQADPLTRELLQLYHELSMLRHLNDPRGIYTRLPFNLQID